MDLQSDKASPAPEASPNTRDPSGEVDTENELSVKSPVLQKQIRKKRAVSEELDLEPERELDDPTSSKKDKSQAKKIKIKPRRGTRVKVGDGFGPDQDGSEGAAIVLTSAKKRKPSKPPAGPKGNWLNEEDSIILRSKGEGKSWQEITDLVCAVGKSKSDRTLTAVRLRYSKVLKVQVPAEELEFLEQAKKDVETVEKYRFIADRFKELSGRQISAASAKRTLLSANKSEPSVLKDGDGSSRG